MPEFAIPEPPEEEVFGVESRDHAGVKCWPLPPEGVSLADHFYGIMRMRHPFLTDDNHTWSFEPATKPGFYDRIVVRKNEKSSLFLIKPWWVDDGPGALWFSQEVRVATRRTMDFEVFETTQFLETWRAELAGLRDTVRGRARAKKLRSIIRSTESTAAFIRRRWPQYDPSPEAIAA